MIINPIIPIWLMSIICLALIVIIIYDKLFCKESKKDNNIEHKNKTVKKIDIFNICTKVLIVIFIFIINLRFMVKNKDQKIINSNLNVLFVVDTSVSMRALDYNGNNERITGVIDDCCNIVDELSSCKFSIITFGDTAKKLIPFTTDTNMVQAQLKAISLENDYYAKGSSMNLVKDTLEETLKDETKRQNDEAKFIVFFISDGEITKEGETLETFSDMKEYIWDGAVMGYGTLSGGKMIKQDYKDNPTSPYYYLYYYDDNYKKQIAISKLDENNLKQISSDMSIDYIHMDKFEDIKSKLENIKSESLDFESYEQKVSSYTDIYYYFAILLVMLLIINFIIQKRRMQ